MMMCGPVGYPRLAALASALVCAIGGPARAQADPRDVDLERFHWTAARSGVLGAESGAVLGDDAWDLGVWLGTADALRVWSGPSGQALQVARRTSAEMVGALGIGDALELGIGVPVVLDQLREQTSATRSMYGALPAGIGDLSISLKAAVLREASAGVAVAVMGGFTMPSGRFDYRGDRSATFTPAIAVSRSAGALSLAGSLGWRMRERVAMADITVDDELTADIGAAIQVDPVLALEIGGSAVTPAAAPFAGSQRSSSEARAGAAFQFGDGLLVEAIAGVGIVHGLGTPDWRGVIAVRYGR